MSLKETIAAIDKQHGKGSIFQVGSHESVPVSAISTGILSLDHAIGVGGFPRGRIVEVYGPPSGGKTTLCLQVVAESQKTGGTAAYIDAEHALDISYAKALGVDTDNLLVSQPDWGEQALEITDALVKSGEIDILIIDSVASLVPKVELDGEMSDNQMGLQARLMSKALRKITGSVHKSNMCVVFINQIRTKIGIMFGSPETVSGGDALKFYSSLRIDVRRKEAIKNGDVTTGAKTRIKIVKNKVSAPFKEAEVDLMFGTGFSREGDMVDLGILTGVLEKSGSWISASGERLGQGRMNAIESLKSNQPRMKDIEDKIKKILEKK